MFINHGRDQLSEAPVPGVGVPSATTLSIWAGALLSVGLTGYRRRFTGRAARLLPGRVTEDAGWTTATAPAGSDRRTPGPWSPDSHRGAPPAQRATRDSAPPSGPAGRPVWTLADAPSPPPRPVTPPAAPRPPAAARTDRLNIAEVRSARRGAHTWLCYRLWPTVRSVSPSATLRPPRCQVLPSERRAVTRASCAADR